MKMKEWSRTERPRERLLEKGPASLSLAELLAILMRTGTGKQNVVEVAQELLHAGEGSLAALSAMDPAAMQKISGIGQGKAVTIAAAFELGRRLMEERSRFDGISITHAAMLYQRMIPRLKGLDHEECWAVYLNRANFVTGQERLSSGSNVTTSFPRDTLLRHALDKPCTSVALVHNHPSGSPRPSKADILETARVREALSSLGISLLDHIIVCDDKFYSFADERVYLG
ncbi:MAG: DNA repair protein RadC [Bacteroidales bacterium]|nr:DNA repair protein RadC [Bacteroidales bacterium]